MVVPAPARIPSGPGGKSGGRGPPGSATLGPWPRSTATSCAPAGSSSSTSASAPSTASTSTVAAGERVALLGPNGAGKTTTLMMLLGVVTPDSGTVEIAGYRLPRQRSAGRRSTSASPPATCRCPSGCASASSSRMFGQLYGIHDPTPAGRGRASSASGSPHLGRRDGQRALVGPADAGRDREGDAAPPGAARARRAHRVARPRRRAQGPHRPRPAVRRRRHRAARHEPQHGRGRATLRAGRVHLAAAVVADGTPGDVAARFGRDDLEGVFLHLAEEREERVPSDGEGGERELAADPGRRAPPRVRAATVAATLVRRRRLAGRRRGAVRRDRRLLRATQPRRGRPRAPALLLAGILLFHVVFQAEISLATGFMEETWSRNLLNLHGHAAARGRVRRRRRAVRPGEAGDRRHASWRSSRSGCSRSTSPTSASR